ncbi:hypothetical protein NE237_022667 [Protea cynaroides]|uniref:Protein kinase domain-containing protein n=1 Tax=Protea cynaroides TaxID=273540 RepID=A0A9Q0HAV1_9MAGN|nr:hypothetical protein NE237_022667 [Protea cynaroides]
MEPLSHGGMWIRGKTIGRGSFGNRWTHLPQLMAVKWAERETVTTFDGCPYILHCYGDEITTKNGELQCLARHYTRSILQGLNHIHNRGYVHCDIKPHWTMSCLPRLLLLSQLIMTRKRKRKRKKERHFFSLRGTPLYMLPEFVDQGFQR